MHRTAFPAMGTTFELLLDADADAAGADADGAFAWARHEIARLEGLLSRFDPGSELSRLNATGAIDAGPELFELITAAFEARDRTGGRFDPTVHDALVEAGYDRTFDDIETRGRSGAGAARCGGRVRLDRRSRRVALDPGVRVDLGGLAKGWTADRVLPRLAALGPALVNAGGDLAACGRRWPVGIESAPGLTISIAGGGVATSGRDRRRWTRAGSELHHLIDPATAAPAEGDLLTVTVVGETAAEAEVLATALFLAGSVDAAAAEANEAGVSAVLVTWEGRTHLTGALR